MVETVNRSVGEVLAELEEQGVVDNTIVFFASDNGPWLDLPDRMLKEGNKPWHQGSTGTLRGFKATSYEGSTRLPGLLQWPGRIRAAWTPTNWSLVPTSTGRS